MVIKQQLKFKMEVTLSSRHGRILCSMNIHNTIITTKFYYSCIVIKANTKRSERKISTHLDKKCEENKEYNHYEKK